MSLRTLVVFGAFCVVLAPGEVRAEWLLGPFIGGAFGGGVAEPTKVDYGGSVGWLGRVVGFEVDVSHRPDFFQATDVPDFLFSESSVRSRIGGEDDFIRENNRNFGFNVGGGVLGYLTDHFGVRGDIRYFKDLQELEGESEFFNPGNEKLDFWRVTGGITFRF